MKQIRIPYNGKGHNVSYESEMVDLSMTPVGFMNVYSVFVNDAELQSIVGKHFTLLHNPARTIKPCFADTPNIEANNLKKTIAQQIMNNEAE